VQALDGGREFLMWAKIWQADKISAVHGPCAAEPGTIAILTPITPSLDGQKFHFCRCGSNFSILRLSSVSVAVYTTKAEAARAVETCRSPRCKMPSICGKLSMRADRLLHHAQRVERLGLCNTEHQGITASERVSLQQSGTSTVQ
jgi:hypothetical protein